MDDSEIRGILHAFIAFDWGEEIRLDEAARRRPARPGDLNRRPRTPSSIAYRPTPLQFALPPLQITLPELGMVEASAEATAFDFGAVSLALRVPFDLGAISLVQLASGLQDPTSIVAAAISAIEDLYASILPAIRRPLRTDLSEEYFVFQLEPGQFAGGPSDLLATRASWLASLLRLDAVQLSDPEVVEALRHRLTYSASDLFLCEWAAAVLIDCDCGETLQVIEFANVQLLEFRHIDRRLDDRLNAAYDLISPLAHSWLPFWRTNARPLRALGEMKVEANALFERTNSAMKLVGDQYLARVYRLLAARLHLEEWEKNIRQSLDVVQEVYQVVSDQAASYRTELLEVIVVVLILVEIVIAILRH